MFSSIKNILAWFEGALARPTLPTDFTNVTTPRQVAGLSNVSLTMQMPTRFQVGAARFYFELPDVWYPDVELYGAGSVMGEPLGIGAGGFSDCYGVRGPALERLALFSPEVRTSLIKLWCAASGAYCLEEEAQVFGGTREVSFELVGKQCSIQVSFTRAEVLKTGEVFEALEDFAWQLPRTRQEPTKLLLQRLLRPECDTFEAFEVSRVLLEARGGLDVLRGCWEELPRASMLAVAISGELESREDALSMVSMAGAEVLSGALGEVVGDAALDLFGLDATFGAFFPDDAVGGYHMLERSRDEHLRPFLIQRWVERNPGARLTDGPRLLDFCASKVQRASMVRGWCDGAGEADVPMLMAWFEDARMSTSLAFIIEALGRVAGPRELGALDRWECPPSLERARRAAIAEIAARHPDLARGGLTLSEAVGGELTMSGARDGALSMAEEH